MGLFRFDCLQPQTAMYERLVLAVLAPPHSGVPANIYYHSSQGRTSESSWWRDAADTATGNTHTCCCGGGQREKSITCCSLILNDTMQWCMTIRFRIKIFQCRRQCHGLLCELILYSITYLFIPSCHYMFCVWVGRGRRRLHLHWRQWKL